MPRPTTQKETVEYDADFLSNWNEFCDSHGLKKRLASHASRLTFMKMDALQREKVMEEAMHYVVESRTKRGPKRKKK